MRRSQDFRKRKSPGCSFRYLFGVNPKYPIGIQSFSDIMENGFVYVDKTDLVYKMATEGKVYFLSRLRQVICLGINFSSATDTIDGYEVG